MVKIEAVVHPSKAGEVKAILLALDVRVIGISEIAGPTAQTAVYRGTAYRVELPMVKIEILASGERADEIVDALLVAARTHQPVDDGVVLVFPVADAVCIHNGARLQYALS